MQIQPTLGGLVHQIFCKILLLAARLAPHQGDALLVAEGRSVLPRAESDCFLARLSSLPIHTDNDPLPARRPRILALARDQGLSSYDATYLELAQRLGATLASFDRQLNQAASANAVTLFSQL